MLVRQIWSIKVAESPEFLDARFVVEAVQIFVRLKIIRRPLHQERVSLVTSNASSPNYT